MALNFSDLLVIFTVLRVFPAGGFLEEEVEDEGITSSTLKEEKDDKVKFTFIEEIAF
ncbi:100_t:CDS:2 [Entrophospora sp. SA101]|nr:100_t:CDS:2 [Entrophospora sp. SA101]